MKKRAGMVFVVGLVLVLSLMLAASALALEPSFTSVSPSSAAADKYADTTITIKGLNWPSDLMIGSVTLQQTTFPYDYISATNISDVGWWMTGPSFTCDVDTWNESVGYYDIMIEYTYLLGQPVQQATMSSAFQVTGSQPTQYPAIASISPKSKEAGSAAFTLQVNGSNFETGPTPAQVWWNDTRLTLTTGTIINPTSVLYAAVPASLVASPGTVLVTVVNPNLGGGYTSNSAVFNVTAAQPTLTGINPTQTWAKLISPPAVTVNGTNFQNGTTQVLVNGAQHAASFVSSTQMTCQLTAADIANPGTLNFTVRNGASGTPTAAFPFTVQAETTLPTITISGADDLWHNSAVTLTINPQDSQSGIQKVMYLIGSMPFTQLTPVAPNTYTITVPGPLGGDTNGVNTVQVYALDNTNAQSATASATVNICTTPADAEILAPASVKKGKSLKLNYSAQSITPMCTYQIKIKKSNGSVAKTINIGEKAPNKNYSTSFTCNLAPGKYKAYLYVTDAAGNKSSAVDAFQVTK